MHERERVETDHYAGVRPPAVCVRLACYVSKRFMVVQPAPLHRPIAAWLASFVRTHVCVGPRHYCRNRNPTPIFSWNPTLSLYPWRAPLLLLLPPVLFPFFIACCLISISPHHTSSRQPDTHAACSLPRARLLRSSNIYTTARRAAATSTPAGHQASMDMVSQSEHLCYVRCTYCNTVLAVNSSRNRIRIMKHLSWRRS